MSNLVDLTGKRFGRLEVLRRGEDRIEPSGKHRVMWICKCNCDKHSIVNVSGDALKEGRSTSCGCFRNESSRARNTTHGDTNTKLYSIWCAMKTRCTNQNTEAYKDYGGRGICICDEWLNNYESFKTWALNNGYEQGLSIDRIDNDKGYEPQNCRWVTSVAQANNRRSNRLITYNGETHNVTEWASILNKNPKTIFNRLYSGWDVDKALST